MTQEQDKMQPGDDLHLTMLMARHSLNFVTGQDRERLLAWGRDVWQAASAQAAPVPAGYRLQPLIEFDAMCAAQEADSARIAELESQMEAIGAGGVEPLRKCTKLHQIAEPVLSSAQSGEQVPVAGQSRMFGGEWGWCSVEHVAMVLAAPSEWKDYEVRYLYTHPSPARRQARTHP